MRGDAGDCAAAFCSEEAARASRAEAHAWVVSVRCSRCSVDSWVVHRCQRRLEARVGSEIERGG